MLDKIILMIHHDVVYFTLLCISYPPQSLVKTPALLLSCSEWLAGWLAFDFLLMVSKDFEMHLLGNSDSSIAKK